MSEDNKIESSENESAAPQQPETPVVTNISFDDDDDLDVDSDKLEVKADNTANESSSEDETDNEDLEDERVPEPAPHSLNTIKDHDVYVVIPKHLAKLDPIIVTARRGSRMTKDVQSWKIDRDSGKDPEVKNHAEKVLYGHLLVPSESFTEKDLYEITLDNPEAEWGQDIPHDNKLIETKYARPKEIGAGQTRLLTGAAAKQRVSSLLGLGITARIPLVHSGFNVELSARSAADVMGLDVSLQLDKVKAGNESSGIIFQNSQYGTVEKVFNFIMESVTAANVANYLEVDLADYIRVTDLPLLYRGMGECLYPDGYPLELECSADINTCRHSEHINLNIARTVWYNRNGLSNAQKSQLLKARHNFTTKEILEYQEIGNSKFIKTVSLTSSNGRRIDMLLRVPTVNQYLDSGREYVAAATAALEHILVNRELNDDQRREFIDQQMNLNILREYGHWVEALVIDKTDRIEGIDDVSSTLNTMSSDGELVKQAFAEIQVFIEESTTAIVAIPNFSCPACGKDYETETSKLHPELVPIDTLKLFFELKDRRLQYQV